MAAYVSLSQRGGCYLGSREQLRDTYSSGARLGGGGGGGGVEGVGGGHVWQASFICRMGGEHVWLLWVLQLDLRS